VQTLDAIKIFDDNAPKKARPIAGAGQGTGTGIYARQPVIPVNTDSANTGSDAKFYSSDKKPVMYIGNSGRGVVDPPFAIPSADVPESENPALDQAKADTAELNRFLRNT
jgi:hypothetical protein